MKNYEIIIIGGGPAGASAGIYAKRAGSKTLIIDSLESELFKAKTIQNYYGFENISGAQLLQNGIDQYKKLGGEYQVGEVVSIVQYYKDNTFLVKTTNEEYNSKVVILCMGGQKVKKIEGLKNFENVSYCAICDGFLYRNKNVAVIGSGNYALSECLDLINVASKVYLLTDGQEIDSKNDKIAVIKDKVKSFEGQEKVNTIYFENNNKLNVDGVFVAVGKLGSMDISLKLGILTNKGSIIVDKNMMTNINGVFAGGDAIGGLLQISKSVGDGAKAGLEAVRYLRIMEANNGKKG